MADDSTWFMWIAGIAASGSGMMLAYLNVRDNAHAKAITRATEATDAIEKRVDNHEGDLKYIREKVQDGEVSGANLRTSVTELRAHVSENYTTKIETQNVRVETQHMLERLHGRIDDVVKSINDMPQTIINLLGKAGH